MTNNYDVFLSHSSTDKAWVNQLKDNLLKYNISVWLDQDEIRPGDLFVEALEHGLNSSTAMALIVSSESLASGWVKEEYARAIALTQTKTPPLQLIPVILEMAKQPGFLQSRNAINFHSGSYNHNVYDLVWGISGQKPDHLLDVSASSPPPKSILDSPTPDPPSFPIHDLPFKRNPNFTGRDSILAEIEQTFGNSIGVPRHVLTGLGGGGKSQIALEYAYRHAEQYALIAWIRAEEETTISADFQKLAQLLHLPIKAGTAEQRVYVNLVRHWLNHSAKPWLLIFDNAEQPERLTDILPRSGPGHILMTSRNPDWSQIAQSSAVKPFTPQEAEAFLLTRTGQDSATAAQEVAELLAYFPLALAQAGAYMGQRGVPLARYAALYRKQR